MDAEQVIEKPPSAAKETGLFKVVTRISQVMAAIGAVIFAGMMIITVIDVSGRKFFLHPLNGAVELVGLLLVIGGTWGMGYCQLLKMHIRINILTERFGRRIQALSWLITCLISLAASGLIAWKAFSKVRELLAAQLGNRTDILGMPVWPFVAMMGIGFAWMGLILILDIYRSANEVFKK